MTIQKILVLFSTIVVFNGCLLLNERNPENPINNQQNRRPPVTAEEFIESLHTSFELKNPSLYLQNISKTVPYQFIPDNETGTRYNNQFINFSYTKEERFIFSLFSRPVASNDSSSIVEMRILSQQLNQDRLDVEIQYSIRLLLQGLSSTTIQGRSLFKLIRGEDSGYLMIEWQDFKIGNLPTISEWKAIL